MLTPIILIIMDFEIKCFYPWPFQFSCNVTFSIVVAFRPLGQVSVTESGDGPSWKLSFLNPQTEPPAPSVITWRGTYRSTGLGSHQIVVLNWSSELPAGYCFFNKPNILSHLQSSPLDIKNCHHSPQNYSSSVASRCWKKSLKTWWVLNLELSQVSCCINR